LSTPLPLSSGATIPAVGFATWKTGKEIEPDQVKDAILSAVKSGYRHFDTSSANEVEVGTALNEAIKKGKVKREEVFVTVTLRLGSEGEVAKSLNRSLVTLGLEYVDLIVLGSEEYLLHASGHAEELHTTDKARATGLKDVEAGALKKVLDFAPTSIPVAIRIIANPYEPQQDIIGICKERSIHVIAYSPFRSSANGSLFNHDTVTKLAEKHDCVPEKILLSWHVARGSSVLVDEVILGGSEGHRELVQLDEEDMAALAGISTP
jgi:diketogulonate reductase-like aldo/keto reductase